MKTSVGLRIVRLRIIFKASEEGVGDPVADPREGLDA